MHIFYYTMYDTVLLHYSNVSRATVLILYLGFKSSTQHGCGRRGRADFLRRCNVFVYLFALWILQERTRSRQDGCRVLYCIVFENAKCNIMSTRLIRHHKRQHNWMKVHWRLPSKLMGHTKKVLLPYLLKKYNHWTPPAQRITYFCIRMFCAQIGT